MIIPLILTTLLIHFSPKGWENVLFELGSELFDSRCSFRWLLVHVPFCRYMRELLGIINTGPVPPAILRLSDGGHIENLALLPLLKRRLQRIVVVNGGYTVPDSSYGDDLVHALELAREKLGCSFLGANGRDVLSDINCEFVNKDEQPRYNTIQLMNINLSSYPSYKQEST